MSDEPGAMNVIELVEWFEDVAAGRAGARLVTVISPDTHARQATLQAFYQSLAEHRSFGPVWPTTLPDGGLAPKYSNEYFMPAPRFTWLGICASDEPAAESVQLADQLEALAQLGNAQPWVREASAGPFRATLGPQHFDGAGDSADHTFSFLGEPIGGIATRLSAAVRALDAAIEEFPLLPDDGALQIDAPRPRARAAVAAGWLQRLATHGPVVFVVDEAQKAGVFLGELVDHLLAADAPILVVLAGEPVRTSDAERLSVRSRGRASLQPSDGRPRLSGRFNTYEGQPVTAVSLPAGATGDLASALAVLVPTGVFSQSQAHAVARALSLETAPQIVLQDLLRSGWIRRLTDDVSAFINDDRRAVARAQGESVFTPEVISSASAALANVAEHAVDVDRLSTLVELGAASHSAPAEQWRYARLLAAYGELGRALRVGEAVATDAERWATTAAWRFATSGIVREERAPSEPSPMSLAIAAATVARRDPDRANALLARSLASVSAEMSDGFTTDLRLRLAAARVFLCTGDLAGVNSALGDDLRRWMSLPAVEQLARLSTWRALPGMVSRTADMLSSLALVDTLRATMPGSAALTYALVARLELLERVGRLDSAPDALDIAWEAGHLLAAGTQRRPTITWRAVLWLSWANQRRGDTSTALALLDQLLAEQRSVLPQDHPSVVTTRQWKARCLLDAGQHELAHAEMEFVLEQRLRTMEADNPHLIAAHHWHAEVLARLRRHAEAADELRDVVARRERTLAADDEDLLSSRHRLGTELANCGHFTEALRQLNEVVARRSRLDIEDAPRLLAARHSRAVCMLMAGRHAESLVELDQILAHRENHLAVDAPVLVNARADRATCLIMLGRPQHALAELEFVISVRRLTMSPDEAALVNVRQQRVHCLLMLSKLSEAAESIDEILRDVEARWDSADPLLIELRRVRAQLQPA